jgi:hypothetical protein
VQKCGGNGTVLPRHSTTRARTSVIFMQNEKRDFSQESARMSNMQMLGSDRWAHFNLSTIQLSFQDWVNMWAISRH